MDKRVIVQHASGLREIAGLLADLQTHFNQPGVPAFCPKVQFRGRIADYELARVEGTYVLYREMVPSPPVDDGA